MRGSAIGVGRGDVRRDLADHVLARFEPDELPGIEAAIARAADAVETWVSDGLAKMMNVVQSRGRRRRSAGDVRTVTLLAALRGERPDVHKEAHEHRPSVRTDLHRSTRNHRRGAGRAAHSRSRPSSSASAATIEKTENWGRRKLAYEIGRHREGVYVLEVINGPGAMTAELDRRLRVFDIVIRHMVVRVDEELAVAERARDAPQGGDGAAPRAARAAARADRDRSATGAQEEDDDMDGADGSGFREGGDR